MNKTLLTIEMNALVLRVVALSAIFNVRRLVQGWLQSILVTENIEGPQPG